MKQKIDGNNNLQVGSVDGDFNCQIARRDIVNVQTESARPTRLDQLYPDELRAERDWAKHLIQDSKNKIWNSWPIKLMKYTVPLFIVGTLVLFQLKWLIWFTVAGMICIAVPYLLLLKVNETEFRLIHSRREVIDYVYHRLREFGIDER